MSADGLRGMQKADGIIKKHRNYEKWCAKWQSSMDGQEYCVPPMAVSSFFFPSIRTPEWEDENGDKKISSVSFRYFDGLGKEEDSINIKTASGKLVLETLVNYGEYVFGGGYTGPGATNAPLHFARSVFTFCRRPKCEVDCGYGQPCRQYCRTGSKSNDEAIYIKDALEMGKQAQSEAQTPNLMIYYGGDFLFDQQINEAAIHDVLVMMGGLLAVCIFCTIHFRSAFLTFIVALQIILSFAVTYFVYRVMLQVEQVPIIMLLGIFVIIGIGVDDAFVFYDHLQSEPGNLPDDPIEQYAIAMTRTYRKTGSAMFVTTTTSACSFASNIASKIPALRIFGLSICVCVVVNFIFVLTVFPSAMAIHRFMQQFTLRLYRGTKSAIVGGTRRLTESGRSAQASEGSASETAEDSIRRKKRSRFSKATKSMINAGNFKFWDWLAELVGTRKNSICLMFLTVVVLILSFYMVNQLKFAGGKVQFFPEHTNIHQFEERKSDFSLAIENCDYRCTATIVTGLGDLAVIGSGLVGEGELTYADVNTAAPKQYADAPPPPPNHPPPSPPPLPSPPPPSPPPPLPPSPSPPPPPPRRRCRRRRRHHHRATGAALPPRRRRRRHHHRYHRPPPSPPPPLPPAPATVAAAAAVAAPAAATTTVTTIVAAAAAVAAVAAVAAGTAVTATTATTIPAVAAAIPAVASSSSTSRASCTTEFPTPIRLWRRARRPKQGQRGSHVGYRGGHFIHAARLCESLFQVQ